MNEQLGIGILMSPLGVLIIGAVVWAWNRFKQTNGGWYLAGAFIMLLGAGFIGYGLYTQCDNVAVYERCEKP